MKNEKKQNKRLETFAVVMGAYLSGGIIGGSIYWKTTVWEFMFIYFICLMVLIFCTRYILENN